MKKNIIFIIFITCLAAGAHAEENKTHNNSPSSDPEVIVKPPKHYSAQKILLFPLELPSYLVRGATYPIYSTLNWMETNHVSEKLVRLLSNEKKTFAVYPLLEAGFGSGFGGGLGIRHSDVFGENYLFNISGLIFTDKDHRANLSLKSKTHYLLNRPFFYGIQSFWSRERDERFFEIGNSSNKNNEAIYRLDHIGGGLESDWVPFNNIHFKTGFFADYSKTATGTGGKPSVETLFPAATLFGFNNSINYIIIKATLTHDTRDGDDAPERGGLRSFSFSRYQDMDGQYNYNEYELNLRQIIPLGKPRFAFVLSNTWSFQQETGSSQIPFHYLSFLDVTSPLRGFKSGRFRDHGTVVFNAEYRYPVWDMIDGTIFVDTGRVFDDWEDFSFNNFKYSVGGGIHIISRDFLIFRLQAAYGGEGVNVVFSASHVL